MEEKLKREKLSEARSLTQTTQSMEFTMKIVAIHNNFQISKLWNVHIPKLPTLRAITSVDVKLCKIIQNGKKCSFYTIWAKKTPTSVWVNLCINASCYSTHAYLHGYCSMSACAYNFLTIFSLCTWLSTPSLSLSSAQLSFSSSHQSFFLSSTFLPLPSIATAADHSFFLVSRCFRVEWAWLVGFGLNVSRHRHRHRHHHRLPLEASIFVSRSRHRH